MPERESVSTIRLGEELEGLVKDLGHVLPADAPPDYTSDFDAGAYGELCRRVERCLALRRSMVEGEFKSSARVQMRAADLQRRLDRDLVKRMVRAVVETIPAPEITASDGMARKVAARKAAGAAVKLYRLLTENASVLTGQPATDWWRAELSKRVSHMIEFHQDQITKMLRADDPPDVRSLATDLLRMDVLHMVLRDLSLDNAAATVNSNMKVTARLTLHAASDAVERYVANPDEFNRFDLAIVITAVDDLIAVIERVIEADREAKAAEDLFSGLGEEAVQRFVKNMGVLTLAIFDNLASAAGGGELTPGHLEKHLAKVERVYDFCALVSPSLKSNPHAAATNAIKRRSGVLVEELTGWAVAQNSRAAQDCLKSLQAFLVRLPMGT